MINQIKRNLVLNAKNLIGWSTGRKIVVISVDDYGNVRLDSKEALERMKRQGLTVKNRFDAYDTLETRQDLESLYQVLTSVKDKSGRHAVFTTFAMPCNIDFEKMAATGFTEYHYELLPETFSKLADQQPKAYEGAWKMLNEGMERNIMIPQFHGREHLNLKLMEEKLASNDHEVLTALKNRSYSCISSNDYETISYTAAFEFWEFKENTDFIEIIVDGLNAFERVFGHRAIHFNPSGGREHPVIHKTLYDNGVKFLDTPMLKLEHQGKGTYKKVFNYTGKRNHLGQLYLVRNVVFEPTDNRGVDWVSYALKQIEVAFRWNRPAIISSHRVNYCGHINAKNRKKGLQALKELLQKITKRWPEIEFMAANELGELIDWEKE